MPDLQRRLREDLDAAMRARDRDQVRVLRTILSAIANAEAQPSLGSSVPPSSHSSGHIAGAALGVGAAEVPRRELTPQQVLEILKTERDQTLATAELLAGRGRPDAATALRADAALLARYLT